MCQTLQQLGIDRLSVAERVELIGAIWDSLDEAGAHLPFPDWYQSELERRRATAEEADPQEGVPSSAIEQTLASQS